jgi:ATP-dependent Clp protease ATP-binding subunit ClpA
MFQKLRQRLRDMRTLKDLCLGAEQHANAEGQQMAGAEHFILAALDLPDGTARRAFERIGADPRQFRAAIARQYGEALSSIGLGSLQQDPEPVPSRKGVYHTKTSAQTLMQQLAARGKTHPGEPLFGAHVVAVAAGAQQGVAARALRAMGIESAALAGAAQAEIASAIKR